MRCLYCDCLIDRYSLHSMFIKNDKLCINCRSQLKVNRRMFLLEDLKCEAFYDYEAIKSMLIQYKECYDEALAPVFTYSIAEYIRIKYHGYKIILMPSSIEKYKLRGFNHLYLIYKEIGLDIIDGLSYINEYVQEGKSKNERLKMLNNFKYTGKPIDKLLIVDDVCTTGSSLLGAYKCLKPYCLKIKAVVLSKKDSAFILKNDLL